MDNNAITPQKITELKQISPEEIGVISEQVLETTKVMNNSADELENLSESLDQFVSVKYRYDEASKKVKKQMRELIPKL